MLFKYTLSDEVPEDSNILKETPASNRIHCASHCLNEKGCLGFGFDTSKTCTLLSVHMKDNYCDSNSCVPRKDAKIYMSVPPPTTTTTEKPTTTTTTTETPTTTTTTTETPTTTTTTTETPTTTTTTTETPTTTTTTETPTTTTTTKAPTTTTTTETPTTTTKAPTTTTTMKTTTTEAATTTKKAITTPTPTTIPPPTTPTEPDITTERESTAIPTIEIPKIAVPTIIAVCGPLTPDPLMRGLTADKSYFDFKKFTRIVCDSAGGDPFVEGPEHIVEAKGDEVGKCKENSAITKIDFYVDIDNILHKFLLWCQELKEEYVVSGEMTTVGMSGYSLDCNNDAVMAGIEAKRDGKIHKLTAHCQKRSSTKAADTETPVAEKGVGVGGL
ncbi:hypothetical protein JTE90_004312 [Oedothorax gibbosus]|uniref:Apple domain-containing protein n=1 Tax=Oedothorax gibbosus TaxID=931172 RepID=A0AAV6VMU2_9ARAC|nr:hypothetical protein JTE90_004312 [Oedothorax gibbosus]